MNDRTQIRILLLDELGLFRASLAHFLASQPDFEVTGECGSFAEALEVLKRSTVDVMLLDFNVAEDDSMDFISAARQAGYQGRFLMVVGVLDGRKSARMLKLGASGIFLKSEVPDRLVQAIRLISDGEAWVDPKVIHLLAEQFFDQQNRVEDQQYNGALDDRERNVLLGILGGLANRKIGENMGLSESSVKNIVQRLFAKAGVRTRSQLVRAALEGSLDSVREFIREQTQRTATIGCPNSSIASRTEQSHESPL